MKWKDIKQKQPTTPESAALLEREQTYVQRTLALMAARQARGLTQVQLAERLGISQSNVSRLEQGEDPQLSTLHRYVAALGGRLEVRAIFDDGAVALSPPQTEPTS